LPLTASMEERERCYSFILSYTKRTIFINSDIITKTLLQIQLKHSI
jgi:hypothetical protein